MSKPWSRLQTHSFAAYLPKFLKEDSSGCRAQVAQACGLIWSPVPGDSRVCSVQEALAAGKSEVKAQLRRYSEALTGRKEAVKGKLHALRERLVFYMLHLDCQPFRKRGAGYVKAEVSREQQKCLLDAYVMPRAKECTGKQKAE